MSRKSAGMRGHSLAGTSKRVQCFAVNPFAIEEAALAVGGAEEPDGAAADGRGRGGGRGRDRR